MKRALIVGINYVGTGHPLKGCINDAHNMHRLVLDDLGFSQTKLVLEDAATTEGIMSGLRWLVEGTRPGDVLLFHFSGHGSQVRSNIEPDGLDEIICPIDLDWKTKVIKDDQLKEVFSTVPNGVNVTVILDCCHSGSGLDQDGSLFEQSRTQMHQEVPLLEKEQRFLPMPADVQAEIDAEHLEIREFKTSRDVNRSALLIAGCMSHQTSADAFIGGVHQGAATYALLDALAEGKKTYRDLVMDMTEYMEDARFSQRPQLDGHPSLYDQFFLEPWGTADGQPVVVPPPGTWQPPVAPIAPVQPAAPEQDGNPVTVAIAVAVVAAILFFILVA